MESFYNNRYLILQPILNLTEIMKRICGNLRLFHMSAFITYQHQREKRAQACLCSCIFILLSRILYLVLTIIKTRLKSMLGLNFYRPSVHHHHASRLVKHRCYEHCFDLTPEEHTNSICVSLIKILIVGCHV